MKKSDGVEKRMAAFCRSQEFFARLNRVMHEHLDSDLGHAYDQCRPASRRRRKVRRVSRLRVYSPPVSYSSRASW